MCVLSLKMAQRLQQGGPTKPLHALVFRNHTFITNAFLQAEARQLYEQVRHYLGPACQADAAKNEYEYLAELPCAYLDRLDYFPHDQDEVWGTTRSGTRS